MLNALHWQTIEIIDLMKRYCKNVDLTNIHFLTICAEDCLKTKWNRRDTLRYFMRITGRDEKEVKLLIEGGGKNDLVLIAAQHMKNEIEARRLNLTPIWYKEKVDASSRKIRKIGIQDVSQQLYDYVAVYAMQDLMRRIGEYQCASIPGRGPVWGKRHVQRWLKDKQIKYVAQLDVKKCFPSIPQDKIIAMIDKYVANDDVRWLVRELIKTFETGLSIGSFLSQYLCNLYLSQLYHEISENMYYIRRGKRINYVKHVLFYMDDILLLGCNAKQMHKCVNAVIAYSREKLGLEIKSTWTVKKIDNSSFIDTMGFRIYRDRVTIRRRVFLRARRTYKRAIKRGMSVQRARRCISYVGCIKHTNSVRFAKKYNIYKTVRRARRVISDACKSEF